VKISAGGRILDAGCGSGRDSLAFMRKGYQVVSIDASGEMVAAASRLTGQSAVLMRFDEVAFDGEFDADWACASLLHVARRDLQSAEGRMVLAASASQIVSSDLEIFLAMLVFYHSRKADGAQERSFVFTAAHK